MREWIERVSEGKRASNGGKAETRREDARRERKKGTTKGRVKGSRAGPG